MMVCLQGSPEAFGEQENLETVIADFVDARQRFLRNRFLEKRKTEGRKNSGLEPR